MAVVERDGFPQTSDAVKVTVLAPQLVGPPEASLTTLKLLQSLQVAPPKVFNHCWKVGLRFPQGGDWDVAGVTRTGPWLSVMVIL